MYASISGCDRDRLVSLLSEDENVHRRLKRASPVLKTVKLEAWSAAVDRLYGPRWALTGNAAEFLDPVFSSGVTLALESAGRAAKLIHRSLEREQVDWETEYAAVVGKAVGVFRVFVRSWYEGELPRLLGSAPDTLVAYRYKPAKRNAKPGKWVAVPVQVDERAMVDFGQTPSGAPGTQGTVYGTPPIGASVLQYTDPNTFVGPDPDPTLDGNDEVSFMSSDTGARAPAKVKRPRHVRRGGATRVVVTDPLSMAKAWETARGPIMNWPKLPN